MPICKWLFVKNLCSKTLEQIQNFVPHRLMSRLKSKTTAGDPHARVTGLAVERNWRLVLSATRNNIIAFNGAMLSES
jgi:hypothetical protein